MMEEWYLLVKNWIVFKLIRSRLVVGDHVKRTNEPRSTKMDFT